MASEARKEYVLTVFHASYAIESYLRFAEIPYHLQYSRYPSCSATGEFPQLRITSARTQAETDSSSSSSIPKPREKKNEACQVLIPNSEILGYLKVHVLDIDAQLEPEQRSLREGILSMIETCQRCLLDTRYRDEEHFSQVTTRMMKETIPFPLNYLLPDFQRMEYLWKDIVASSSSSMLWIELKSKAMAAYESMDTLLGKNEWVLGTKRPTSADAVLFGHLVSVAIEPIRDILWSFPNLEAYRKRIALDYFLRPSSNSLLLSVTGAEYSLGRNCIDDTMREILQLNGRVKPPTPTRQTRQENKFLSQEAVQAFAIAKKPLSEEELKFQRESRFAVAFAFSSVVLYAIFTGIIEIDLSGLSLEEEEVESNAPDVEGMLNLVQGIGSNSRKNTRS